MKALFVAIISSKKSGLHILEKFFWFVKKQETFTIGAHAVALLKADGTVVQWACTKGGFKNFLALSRPWWYNLM